MLPPASFLPLAEETGLIEAVDRWVHYEACRQARAWSPDLAVSVNLSPGRLRSGDLHEHATHTLAQTGLDPGRLMLELSERTLFDDEPDAIASLAEIAKSGVGLALDDFGAGYTSIAQLHRLPLSRLKIDNAGRPARPRRREPTDRLRRDQLCARSRPISHRGGHRATAPTRSPRCARVRLRTGIPLQPSDDEHGLPRVPRPIRRRSRVTSSIQDRSLGRRRATAGAATHAREEEAPGGGVR